MIQVLILEDEEQTLRYYQAIVESALTDCNVLTATSGKKALSLANKHQIDLMLLDMELDEEREVLGVDYANQILAIQPNIDFIVISGNSDYLKDAKNVEPFYYFMKPIDDTFLARKLVEWEVLRSTNDRYEQKSIVLSTENGMAIIPIAHICLIEKMNRKVKIITKNRVYICRDSIRNMLSKLDHKFYHAHQSYIVNMMQIESVDAKEDRTWQIKFRDIEEQAILSRYKAKEFFEIYKLTT